MSKSTGSVLNTSIKYVLKFTIKCYIKLVSLLISHTSLIRLIVTVYIKLHNSNIVTISVTTDGERHTKKNTKKTLHGKY